MTGSRNAQISDGPEGTHRDKPRQIPLDEAMQSFAIPLENHVFVLEMATRLGILGCELVGTSYIKAFRVDGERPLNIGKGWTDGFTSEAEARFVAGNAATIWPTNRAKRTWGTDHPLMRSRQTTDGANRRRQALDFGMCGTCGIGLPATLKCDRCNG